MRFAIIYTVVQIYHGQGKMIYKGIVDEKKGKQHYTALKVLLSRPAKHRLGKGGKNKSLKQGYSYLVTQPSTNYPTGQALTLLHDIQRPNVDTRG